MHREREWVRHQAEETPDHANETPIVTPDDRRTKLPFTPEAPHGELTTSAPKLGSAELSPVQKVIAEPGEPQPPMPAIAELGTSHTRELVTAQSAELRTLLQRIKNTTQPTELIATLEETTNAVRASLELLARDSDQSVDATYTSFLRTLERQVVIIRAKLEHLEASRFNKALKTEIALGEFETRIELLGLFPDKDPKEIEVNPSLYELLSREYSTLPDLHFLDVWRTRIKALTHPETLKAGSTTVASIGGIAVAKALGEIALESYAISPIYSGICTSLGSVIGLMGFARTWLEYRTHVVQLKLAALRSFKTNVWQKWFPENPKPQVEQMVRGDDSKE